MKRLIPAIVLGFALGVVPTPPASAAESPATARTAIKSAVAETVTRLLEAPVAVNVLSAGKPVFSFQRDENGAIMRSINGVQEFQVQYLAYFPYATAALTPLWVATLNLLAITGPFTWIADEREDYLPNDAAATAFSLFYADVERLLAKSNKVRVSPGTDGSVYTFTQTVSAPGPKTKGKATKVTGVVTTSVTLAKGTIVAISITAPPALAKQYPSRSLTIVEQTAEIAPPETAVLDLHELDTDPAVVQAMTKVQMLEAAGKIVALAQTYAKSSGSPMTGADLTRARSAESTDFDAFTRVVGNALQIIANPGSAVPLVLCTSVTTTGTVKYDWTYCPD